MGFVLNEKDGSKYLSDPRFEETNLVTHAFSLKTIPTPEKLAETLNINTLDLTHAEQVHEDKIAIIDENTKGKVAKGCDALVTAAPHIPLVIRTADCVPIFLLDPKTKSIALVHAGWKGTLLKIAEKTIQTMRKSFGAQASDILAAIAPSIGECCYEVKKDVIEQLKGSEKNWKEFVTTSKENKWHLNLSKLNISQLLRAGIQEKNITTSKSCTSCEKDMFYSYRRDREKTGRMYGLIMLM